MNKLRALTILQETLREWNKILDNQDESWDNYDRQEGEIDGLRHAIKIIEGLQ